MSFQKILEKYRQISYNQRDKGDKFERLMQRFLQTVIANGRTTESANINRHKKNGQNANASQNQQSHFFPTHQRRQ
jgi:predicted helicase